MKCNGQHPSCRTCRIRRETCEYQSELLPGRYVVAESFGRSSSDLSGEHCPGRSLPSPTVEEASGIRRNNNSILPSQNLLQRLLDIFWTRHHHVEFCGFIHRPSFEEAVLHPSNAFLLNSILSLSSIYISDEEAKNGFGAPSGGALSNIYYTKAKELWKEIFDSPAGKSISTPAHSSSEMSRKWFFRELHAN